MSERGHFLMRVDTKARPAQGKRLVELRKAAGLSQYELAEMLGVPQSNVAFWEQSEKPPRSDLLPKMADVLGVGIVDLLNTNGGRVTVQRSSRPPGKLRKVFEDVSRLRAVSRSILSESSPRSSRSMSRRDDELGATLPGFRCLWFAVPNDLHLARFESGRSSKFWRSARRRLKNSC
jgi:transcriptional regulator with XRE-family HTH domain